MEDGFANSAIKHHVNNTRPYGDVESFVIKVGQLPGDFSESNCWIFYNVFREVNERYCSVIPLVPHTGFLNRIRIIYKPDGVIFSGPWWGK